MLCDDGFTGATRGYGNFSDARSLALDVRGLDNRPPLLDLGLVQRAEFLWSLLIARKNLLNKTDEPRMYRRIGRALTVAALSLAMMAFGVLLGAQNAIQ